MLGWLRAEAARASCSKRWRRSSFAASSGRQDLDRDLAAEARVPRPVDLAHAAGPEGPEDLVRAEPPARGKGQAGRGGLGVGGRAHGLRDSGGGSRRNLSTDPFRSRSTSLDRHRPPGVAHDLVLVSC